MAGWSYSGYAEVLRETPRERQIEMLQELDDTYTSLVARQNELEKELENVKHQRGMCVTSFQWFHRICLPQDQPLNLVFMSKGCVVTVKILGDNHIDYDRVAGTFL